MTLIYEVRAFLVGSDPAIFRILQIPSYFNLWLVHEVFQASFAWENFHRHFFKPSNGIRYENEDKTSLKDVFSSNKTLIYVYDLGNAWTVEVEKIREFESDEHENYPSCVDGSRKSPPEDSGGIVGYQMALDLLTGNGSRNAYLLYDWYGDSFNPDDFSAEDINQKLTSLAFR